MNMKKVKKFFTLARRHDGFTLVELIVVIAILAILGGVAVPAYSGYVKKANMQADISLAAEVADALLLYYYSHPEIKSGYVVLTPENVPTCWYDTPNGEETLSVGKPAMDAVFGAGWENNLSLKYDDWSNSQKTIKETLTSSSFAKDGVINMDLVDAVDNLTGQIKELEDVWSSFDGFGAFLGENGLGDADAQTKANSAVAYLAQGSKENQANRDKVKMSLGGNLSGVTNADQLSDALGQFMVDNTKGENPNCTEFEAVAMMYAVMVGYCLQQGDEVYNDFVDTDLTSYVDANGNEQEVKYLEDVRCALQTKFTDIISSEEKMNSFMEYVGANNPDAKLEDIAMFKDMNAYYGVVDGISENQDYLMEKLDGSGNFYAGLKDYLSAYWSLNLNPGEVAVVLVLDENGQPEAVTYGLGA